jgi:V/A-type H+-transporting ATPase subunit I
LGLARLTKITIISPRSEYDDVAKALAQFEDFHPLSDPGGVFDPGVQELTVKAVRLLAQADQAVKDLGLPLMPGQLDIVFRGAKIPQSEFEAGTWDELLGEAEEQLTPIADEVRAAKAALLKAAKEETDAENTLAALDAVSGFSSDVGGISNLHMFKAVISVVGSEGLNEFKNAVPDSIFLSEALSERRALVLVAVRKADETKLDKAMKLLELKPINIPAGLPQNPAKAFQKATRDREAARASREKVETEMEDIKVRRGTGLLAVRELAEVARKMLDEARVSGQMKRLATISGYIPTKKEAKMRELFGRWMIRTSPVEGKGEEKPPTLMANRAGLGLFQPITLEQGIPGEHEVDPTPIVSFIFPIFFGMMFGDVGHGIILTLFFLLVRERSTGTMRQWANLFLVAGASSIFFGAVFGEFFEFSLYNFVPIPAAVEIIHRAAGSADTFNFLPTPFAGVNLVMIASILIGVGHVTVGLGLDVYEAAKGHNRTELLLGKLPTFTMYVSGVGYGLAFIGAGFAFNVFKNTDPNPLLGIPNDVLGGISLAVLLPSMLVLFLGKSVAIAAGKIKEGSMWESLFNGGLEVFERISQFLSNTISYVRLAVMLLVHAGLLLITNQYFGPSGSLAPWPDLAPIWVLLNLLVLAFEAFIVYVQDLRLHLYEFFTKFFLGTGTPFRKILPDRARIRINWR